MVLIKRLLLLIPLLFAGTFDIIAQDRCGTVAYENLLQNLNPSRKTTDQFENWMKTKVARARLLQKSSGRTSAGPYTIPVVVHVVHNGESIGTGLNVSDAQINSQIVVLNDDFRRLNADAANTPSEFLPFAGPMDIQFILAKQDPNGLSTTGIVRIKGSKSAWAMSDNYALKAQSYWPAEKYLNLWVTDLTGTTLGYAQFPPTDDGLPGSMGLDGLTSSDRLTDGVAIDYKAFGSGSGFSLDPLYNKGRTGTHEVGHFLGLRHIWGDQNCGTDYVDDTPAQSDQTTGCPTNPQASCDIASKPHKMFQNYMDYSSDACMNIYTIKQIERMDIVLNNSARRASLLTSPGAMPPASFDLGIKRVISPTANSCNGFFTPVIKIKNFGTTLITSSKIQFSLNGSTLDTQSISLSLSSQDSISVTFSGVTFSQATSSQLEFRILETNGTTDQNLINNVVVQTVTVPAITDASLAEIFTTFPVGWTISNPDGLKTWENVTANNGSADNKAMAVKLFTSGTETDSDGTTDWLITPVMDFSKVNSALLKFDRAYALLSGASDGLKIFVSNNCGSNFSQAITIFNKTGAELSTISSNSPFTPSSSSQWVTETISLQQFVGQSNIQLAFVVTNGMGRGNNLYLDNVLLTSDAFTDIALTNVTSLSPVICSNNPVPVIRIKNNGSSAITSFNIDRTINGVTTSQSYTNQFIQPSQEKEITLSAFPLTAGSNTITLNVKDPNGITTDALPNNNIFSITTVVNTSTDIIPLRQNFESTFTPAWTIVSQGTQRKWETTNTNKGVSLVYRAFGNNALGSEAWFVSPLLDFSRAQEGSLFFDISYAKSAQGNDSFRILASTDCGVTYPTLVYQRTGDQLAVTNYNFSWSPVIAADWKREYVELNDLAGKENVRLAFIATNNRGNNFYLDNLEIFTDSDPSPPTFSLRESTITPPLSYFVYTSPDNPSIYKVTFNLAEKELIRLQVYNVMGQVVIDNLLPETLNQTYTIDFSQQSTGIYIVRVQVDNYVGTQKIFVGH